MKICDYQQIAFKTLGAGSVNTGGNLVQNGGFDTDFNYWNTANIELDSSTASYVKDPEVDCYRGVLEQMISITSGYHTLRFKYRATSAFIIQISAVNDGDSSVIFNTTITAQADGLWHTVEYSFWVPAAMTMQLNLHNISTGGGEADECGATGTATNGFFWDDVSIYKQTQPANCAPCDIFIIDRNRPAEFQMRSELLEEVVIPNAEFDTNPYDQIDLVAVGEAEEIGFAFDITTLPDNGRYFELYMCGKVFRFTVVTGLTPTTYDYTQTGNFYDIRVRSNTVSVSFWNENLIDAMQEVMDAACGSASVYVPTPDLHFAVLFGTAPVYLNDPYNILSNIVDVTPADVSGNGFYYNPDTGKMCYDYTGNPVQYALAPIALVSGKRYRFRFHYSSEYNDFTGSVTIYNGIGTTQTVNYTVQITDDGYVDIFFTANATANHTLTINFTDPISGLHYAGFCFDQLSLYSIDALGSITVTDCTGTVTTPAYISTAVDDLIFVQILSSGLPDSSPYTIQVTSTAGQVFESYPIQLIDALTPNACRDLLRINWTDDCQYGCLDYSVFPFDNELYLNAYLVALQPARRESETINFRRHFVHSADRYELRVNNYTRVMHLLLARALEHGDIRINGESYYADDDSTYSMTDVGRGQFSARISLIKSGTEVKKSACCC